METWVGFLFYWRPLPRESTLAHSIASFSDLAMVAAVLCLLGIVIYVFSIIFTVLLRTSDELAVNFDSASQRISRASLHFLFVHKQENFWVAYHPHTVALP